MAFNVTILTLYPEIFPGPLDFSILKRAQAKNLWSLKVVNIRDYAEDKYKKVDDTVYGGGAGLLLKPDVVNRAIIDAFNQGASKNLVLLSPCGKQLEQNLVKELAIKDGITIICGHFEGIDYRIIDKYKPLEISMGDYILSGGEIGAMALVDACVRILPFAVNSHESIANESFENGLLEAPQYTKPFNFEGMTVPEVLVSGHHAKITAWKKAEAIALTKQKRPDVWKKYNKQGVKSD